MLKKVSELTFSELHLPGVHFYAARFPFSDSYDAMRMRMRPALHVDSLFPFLLKDHPDRFTTLLMFKVFILLTSTGLAYFEMFETTLVIGHVMCIGSWSDLHDQYSPSDLYKGNR